LAELTGGFIARNLPRMVSAASLRADDRAEELVFEVVEAEERLDDFVETAGERLFTGDKFEKWMAALDDNWDLDGEALVSNPDMSFLMNKVKPAVQRLNTAHLENATELSLHELDADETCHKVRVRGSCSDQRSQQKVA
jgi:hypothetical protein